MKNIDYFKKNSMFQNFYEKNRNRIENNWNNDFIKTRQKCGAVGNFCCVDSYPQIISKGLTAF